MIIRICLCCCAFLIAVVSHTIFVFPNRHLFSYRMDQDGSLNISYDEWRDFLLLAPSHDIQSLILYWRHSTVSEFICHFRLIFFLASSQKKNHMLLFCFCTRWRVCLFILSPPIGRSDLFWTSPLRLSNKKWRKGSNRD